MTVRFKWDTIDGDVIFYDNGAMIDYDDVVDVLNELNTENFKKEDLIQQLKIALDTDDYNKHKEYRRKFINVCEELKEMNCDYANLKKENAELKEAIIGKIQYGEDLEKFAVEKGIIKEDWARFDDYDGGH